MSFKQQKQKKTKSSDFTKFNNSQNLTVKIDFKKTKLVFNSIQLPGFITSLSFSLDKISDIKTKIFAKLNF